MQGSLFIITSWIIVLFLLFYRDRTKKNFLYLAGLLILISCSAYTIDLISIEINFSYIIIIFIISYFISLLNLIEQIGHFFKGLIIGMTYSVVTLLSIYDPASFFIDEMIISSFLVILLSFFLSKSYYDKIRYITIGLVQGDIFNYFTFKSINFKYIIGDLNWFDTLFMSILLLSAIQFIVIYVSKISLKNRKLLKS
ncbi:YphA family membrane protein [Gottfriedia acidiceleris]|uniref:YphA family membrane protein n=1 Tax=Gottfriedia acidiceleris TaxID=371036 RepID=UPI002FFDAF21